VSPRDLVQLARPWQWSKNGILFAGLIFSRHVFVSDYVLRTVAATAVFCLASSAIYAFNDVLDLERDRLHPEKRDRPVASGRVGRPAALALVGVLLAVSFFGAVRLGGAFLWVLLSFVVLNAAYSAWLKKVVILDVMMIALSFVVRAIAGVVALCPLDRAIELSPWLLVCTLFLALFLGYGKRRHELLLLETEASEHRATLGEYTRPFLDQLISVVTAATLIAYAIYTVAPGTVSKFQSRSLVFTVPLVVFGVFRYLYLIEHKREGGNPSRAFYRDLPLLLTILGWLGAVMVILYVGRS